MATVSDSRIQVTGETLPTEAPQIKALIQSAATRLANATTAGEVLDARDVAALGYDSAAAKLRFLEKKHACDDVLSAVYHVQADALSIEAEAKRRLADEYDAAQERGEVGQQTGRPKVVPVENDLSPSAADLGLTRKDIHEARQIRNAELTDPGVVRRTVDAAVARGEEPTRAVVRNAVMPHVAHNSRNNEWYTPAYLLDAAREAMGAIDCDPCSSATANRTVRARRFYTIEDDGLTQAEWGRRVWMNPPYGQPQMGQFVDALVARYAQGDVQEACVLLNNVTETEAFQTLASVASAICFLKGRVKFLDHTGTPALQPLQGQVVVYLGESSEQPSRFCEAFEACGVSMVAYPGMSDEGGS